MRGEEDLLLLPKVYYFDISYIALQQLKNLLQLLALKLFQLLHPSALRDLALYLLLYYYHVQNPQNLA